MASSGIAPPSEDDLPPGAHRDLVLAVHELYQGYGWGGTRTISQQLRSGDHYPGTMSHDTVSKFLNGRTLATLNPVRALAMALAERMTPVRDPVAESERVAALWQAAKVEAKSLREKGRRLPDQLPVIGTNAVVSVSMGADADEELAPTYSGLVPRSRKQPKSALDAGLEVATRAALVKTLASGELVAVIASLTDPRQKTNHGHLVTAFVRERSIEDVVELVLRLHELGRGDLANRVIDAAERVRIQADLVQMVIGLRVEGLSDYAARILMDVARRRAVIVVELVNALRRHGMLSDVAEVFSLVVKRPALEVGAVMSEFHARIGGDPWSSYDTVGDAELVDISASTLSGSELVRLVTVLIRDDLTLNDARRIIEMVPYRRDADAVNEIAETFRRVGLVGGIYVFEKAEPDEGPGWAASPS